MKRERQREPRTKPELRSGAMRYAGMGLELAAAICGLTLAGYWIDQKFGTADAGLITGAALGIVGGLYNFIRQAMGMLAESRSADATAGDEDRQDLE